MARVLGTLDRVPKVVGHEFEQQAFRRRPGEGRVGCELAPCLEVAEVGGECSKRIVAHAFAGEVFECINIVVGQKCGELVTPIEGQDGVEGVELFCTPQHVVPQRRRLPSVECNPWAENFAGSSPAFSQRDFKIRLTDCGVSARQSILPHWSILRNTGPGLVSAQSGLKPITIESGPSNGSTRVDTKPASRIQAWQSAPV